MLPLYASASSAPPRLEDGNAGLWYDKFCHTWSKSWTLASRGDEAPKLAWIRTVANGKPLGSPALLAESAARLHQLTHAQRGICQVFTTESRFVTGLGRRHPIDNGFAWHPTLGVPYLPGSSIKGLIRAWASHDASPPPAPEFVDRLLGTAHAPRASGHVAVLDAIPLAPVRLEADVMTPHHAGWSPEQPPGDWREPVPVPFLVVAPETAFVFSLLPRGIEPPELDLVFAWLRAALLHAGAGAKTAVGYGRFAHDDLRTQKWNGALDNAPAARAAAARRAALSGTAEGRWLEALEGKSESTVLELVRIHLEARPITDPAERRAFARAVASTDYVALWRKGGKCDRTISAGPDKLKVRARLVDAAAGSPDDPEPSR